MTDKRVLTIQDISCMGQCSLTVALPIISACGVETIILPSAVLSTHTGGFTGYTFRDLTEDIPGIMNHWKSENIRFDCLYTGYLGSITQIDYVTELKKEVIREDGLLIVDPAMADFGSLYYGFDQNFVEHMARLCGTADVILPNMTEAAFMTGSELMLENHTEEYILDLIEKLSALGARKVVLKGISYEPDKIGVAVYDSTTKALQYYFTEKISKGSHGTGDCYAAAFTGALMQGRDTLEAAKIAADFVVECIKKTVDDDSHWYGVKFEKALPMLVQELNK
ncbi:MAG: pyridoxamine kinase [Lachnospiraceae bacterium]|nr:pyridoxamine kinase [Lachnospiraceae bacterium]